MSVFTGSWTVEVRQNGLEFRALADRSSREDEVIVICEPNEHNGRLERAMAYLKYLLLRYIDYKECHVTIIK